MYGAVLLDVYGTLLRDDDDRVAEVAAVVAERAGVAPDTVAREWSARLWAMADAAHGPGFRRLADLNRESLAGTAAHFGVPVDAERMCRAQREAGRRAEPFVDALAFLAALTVPVCLVSDADRDDLRAVLDRHAITVDAVVTSEEARAYKPRPEPFLLGLRRLGRPAAEVVHIGDSPASDVAGVGALGIDTVFLSRDGRRLPAGLTATHTADTLTALLPMLGTHRRA